MCIVSMYVENKKKNLIKWGKQSPFMHLELGSKIYVNQVVMTIRIWLTVLHSVWDVKSSPPWNYGEGSLSSLSYSKTQSILLKYVHILKLRKYKH